jgi:uncharacterized protein YneF (UPF0154 family)
MNRPGFSLYDAFATCDLNDNGAITKDELRRLLESRGFYISEKEVNCLVEKIDKDKDGRISYSDVSVLINTFMMKGIFNSYPYHRPKVEDDSEFINSDLIIPTFPFQFIN